MLPHPVRMPRTSGIASGRPPLHKMKLSPIVGFSAKRLQLSQNKSQSTVKLDTTSIINDQKLGITLSNADIPLISTTRANNEQHTSMGNATDDITMTAGNGNNDNDDDDNDDDGVVSGEEKVEFTNSESYQPHSNLGPMPDSHTTINTTTIIPKDTCQSVLESYDMTKNMALINKTIHNIETLHHHNYLILIDKNLHIADITNKYVMFLVKIYYIYCMYIL